MAKANRSTPQETTDKQLFYLPVEGVTVEANDLEEAQAIAKETVQAQKEAKVGDDNI